MTTRLVLLDVDGTLVDSQHHIVEAMVITCQTLGLECPPAARIRRVIGLSLDEAMAALMPDLDTNACLKLSEAYKEAFLALRSRPTHEEHLFPGTLEMLDALEEAGCLLGLATGKSRRGVVAFVERHGLEGRFLTTRTADDGPGKPHPFMVTSAMAELGVEKSQTVMVGDTTYDILMARSAGVGAIGVRWGNHSPTELHQAGADHLLEDFSELLSVVHDLTREAV